jgi:hypothetical protein
MRLAFRPRQQFRGESQGLIEFVNGQDQTTLWGDERFMGCQRRGQRAGEMGHPLGR